MERFSEKVFLILEMPTEELPLSDQKRIALALEALGYRNPAFPLPILRKLYPLCRDHGYQITVTLVYRDAEWVVSNVEPGDTRLHHYGLAVDYGSTTVAMQMVDLNSGTVVAEAKAVNGQTAYGTDILTRITYAMEEPAHKEDLQRVTVQTFEALLSQLTEDTGVDASKCSVMIIAQRFGTPLIS